MASSNTLLAAVLGVYVVVCSFLIYFCVFADPNNSDVAFFFTHTLPKKVSDKFEQRFGKKNLARLTAFTDRALQLVYLAVVLGCWVVVFWYIYPWITQSKSVSNVHKYVGYGIFVACFSSWRKACTASPGLITARSYRRYDHYPFDNLLFVPNKKCETTGIIRIARSKFDRLKYNQNVPRYDHFCGWVYNTIGEENYRWFLLFLGIHVLMCVYGALVCGLLIRGEVVDDRLFDMIFLDRATGETVRANVWIVSQYLFAKRMPECAVFLIMFVMSIALGAFFGYHVHITSKNMTTNEDGKWQDVKGWYKKQKKEYDQAIKNGWIVPTADGDEIVNSKSNSCPGTTAATVATTTAEAPVVSDRDVTCTPTVGTAESQQSNVKSATTIKTAVYKGPDGKSYFDPGPLPKNVYDRGFVENWKEVLFPLSLYGPTDKKSR